MSNQFNRRSTASEVTEGIDLRGKTILITGVGSGLGQESLRVLTQRGAHVIAAARSREKAREACQQVGGKTTPVACELSDLDSVRACADEIGALGVPIDVLMCNAGIMAPAHLQQKMGLELQFLTNHLGHFVLVNRLLPQLKNAAAGRIVMLSSMAHQRTPRGGIDFDNLSGARGYDAWSFYGQSKLANILFAKELSKRLAHSAVTANALHPGVIRTNLGRSMGGLMSTLIAGMAKFIERTIPQGAATQCYVATHPDIERVTGRYFADCSEKTPSAHARDPALAQKLWRASEELSCNWL